MSKRKISNLDETDLDGENLLIQKLITVWRILINFFYYTARPQSLNPIHLLRQAREGFSVQKVRRKYPELYKEICGLIANSGSTGGEWSDYLTLYEEIRSKKPCKILELGSGISSLIICFAIEENAKDTNQTADFFSVEENEYYHRQIVDIFPERYRQKVNFLLRQKNLKRYQNILGGYYENLPKEDFDFIFIDGPTDRTSESAEKSFNADLVNLIEKNKLSRVSGILDMRIFTYLAFKQLLPKLRIKFSVVKKVSFFSFEKNNTLT